MISVELSTASRERLIALGRKFPKAGASALNKIARQAKTFTSAEIRKDYNIKKSVLDPQMSVQARASERNLEARLRAKAKGKIPLYDFGPRPSDVIRPQPGRGVRVTVKKGNRQLFQGTFIARMKSGHIGVFKRQGKERTPIKELFTFRITQLLGSREMANRLKGFFAEAYPRILKQELNYYFLKH